MSSTSVLHGAPAVKWPGRVEPDYGALLSAEWREKMVRLELALRAAGVMAVGARKIVMACYGTEPELVLQALAATRARYSMATTVQRLYRGILDPAIPWTPKPEL